MVVLTTFELDEYVFGALRAGASGFLLKDIEPADVITGVRVVAGGEALLAPRLTRRLIEAFVTGGGAGAGAAEVTDGEALGALTRREREVLALVGRGHSNAETAHRLVLSPLTAMTHVARLFAKLGARDHAQLVVAAYESGLIVAGRGHHPRAETDAAPYSPHSESGRVIRHSTGSVNSVTPATTAAPAPVIAPSAPQSSDSGSEATRISIAPTAVPSRIASASPRATGTAVCNSTDQASVERRVPNAASTDSARRRSRSCSAAASSRLMPITTSTTTAPANRSCRRSAARPASGAAVYSVT